jgi:hypothetical protein
VRFRRERDVGLVFDSFAGLTGSSLKRGGLINQLGWGPPSGLAAVMTTSNFVIADAILSREILESVGTSGINPSAQDIPVYARPLQEF